MASRYARQAQRINRRWAKTDEDKITAQDIAQVLATWGEQCFYCQTELVYGPEGNGSIDHLIPYPLGGRNTLRNLVPCCWHCNNLKGEKFVYMNAPRTRLVFGYNRPPNRRW